MQCVPQNPAQGSSVLRTEFPVNAIHHSMQAYLIQVFQVLDLLIFCRGLLLSSVKFATVQEQGGIHGLGVDASSKQHWRACTGMCVVLQLKRFLIQAYHIKEGLLQAYNPETKKCDPSTTMQPLCRGSTTSHDGVSSRLQSRRWHAGRKGLWIEPRECNWPCR